MVIHFLYNSTTAGGNIKGTLQKLTDSGLGDFWQESSTSFVTTATAFANRSYAVTEQTVGDAAIAYYGSTPASGMSYTGALIKGYHDADDSNNLVFSEVAYVRNGIEVSFTLAQDRTNQEIASPFTWVMGRRADGSVTAGDSIYLSDSDSPDVAFDCSAIKPPGVMVSSISNLTIATSGELAMTVAGPRDQQAVLNVTGGQVAGTTYDVTCDALFTDSSTIELNGKIVTVTTP